MKYPFYSIPSDHLYGLTRRKFESFICLSNYHLYIYLSIVAEYYIGTNKQKIKIMFEAL